MSPIVKLPFSFIERNSYMGMKGLKATRVSRTIADLDENDNIQPHHLMEAINYRFLDRSMWN